MSNWVFLERDTDVEFVRLMFFGALSPTSEVPSISIKVKIVIVNVYCPLNPDMNLQFFFFN